MFRGRNQVDGRWVTQEFTDEEMRKFLDRVAEFDKQAMKVAVEKAIELRKEDVIKEGNEFEVAMALFEKLSLQTFSVVNNHTKNMRG